MGNKWRCKTNTVEKKWQENYKYERYIDWFVEWAENEKINSPGFYEYIFKFEWSFSWLIHVLLVWYAPIPKLN